MQYTVYVLFSARTEKYYAGHTGNLARRLNEHNNGESLSTKHGIPWIVVYQEAVMTRGRAMRREGQIKKRGIERFLRGVAQPG